MLAWEMQNWTEREWKGERESFGFWLDYSLYFCVLLNLCVFISIRSHRTHTLTDSNISYSNFRRVEQITIQSKLLWWNFQSCTVTRSFLRRAYIILHARDLQTHVAWVFEQKSSRVKCVSSASKLKKMMWIKWQWCLSSPAPQLNENTFFDINPILLPCNPSRIFNECYLNCFSSWQCWFGISFKHANGRCLGLCWMAAA